MIPHEKYDYRDKKPPPELQTKDHIAIAIASYVISTSLLYGDFLTLIIGVMGWRSYENYRKNNE